MTRAEILNALLSVRLHPSYLEIGVRRGETFDRVQADRKVAVDPHFMIEKRQDGSDYHEITSDEFFGKNRDTFDLIFLDGMHTFEQTLRDLLNAIPRLNPGGTVVIDDVRPSSHAAALRDESRSQALKRALRIDDGGAWMGDVYRLVFFIQSFLQSFSYATVADIQGMLVMWVEPRPAVPDRSVEAVARMDYTDAILSADYRLTPLADIVRQVSLASMASG